MSPEERENSTISGFTDHLAKRVQEELGENVYLCYQCVKCTSGCPVAEFFDWKPNQIMRAVQLGQDDIALKSKTPWLCASCQTCTTRCPQGLDIARIMEFLTRETLARGFQPKVPEVDIFNHAFMREIKMWGRSYELGLMVEMKLRNMRRRKITEDLDLGIKVIRKNKLPFIPKKVRTPQKPKTVPMVSGAVAYYPGCSLHSTGVEFDESTRAVCDALEIRLVEPKGWVCCGSSAAHRVDPMEAIRLPMENLRIFEQSGFNEATMPCAACYSRHKTAAYEINHDAALRSEMDKRLDYTYRDSVKVSTLTETILNRKSTREIAAKVKRPLTGLKVVCYYGCLLTRPPKVTGAPHPENPTDMDEILHALGAEVLDWSYKTVCCGAAHSLTRPDIVLSMSSKLINHARETGADVIVVSCPLCHTNLDARQFQMKLESAMPVLYFTQLMALAYGLPDHTMALTKNLVDPRPLLKEKGFLGKQ